MPFSRLTLLASVVLLFTTFPGMCLNAVDEDSIAGVPQTAAQPKVIAAPKAWDLPPSAFLLGIAAGVSSDDMSTFLYDEPGTTHQFQPGGSLGLVFRTNRDSLFDFEGAVEFSTLGAARTYNSSYYGAIYDSLNDSIGAGTQKFHSRFQATMFCIALPLHLVFNLKRGYSGTSLFLGPSLAYLVSAHEYGNGSFSNSNSLVPSVNYIYSNDMIAYLYRLNVQLQAGISQDFLLGTIPFFAEAQYSFGLTNIDKEFKVA